MKANLHIGHTGIVFLLSIALLQALPTSMGRTQTPPATNPSSESSSLQTPTERLVFHRQHKLFGQYWALNEEGEKVSSSHLSYHTASSVPRSAAGDRVLWDDQYSDSTKLATMDQTNGTVTAMHPIPSPGSPFRAQGLALASPLTLGCYRTGELQNYYVMWDGSDGTFAVQLIDGTGKVLRTTFTQKPLAHLHTTAVWFGFGADGNLWAMFRDRRGASHRYRATYSPTGYLLDSVRSESLPGFFAMSMTAKPHPTKIFNQSFSGGTAFNDHILWTSKNGNFAKLTAYNSSGTPVIDMNRKPVTWNFPNTSYKATAYTYVPPVCSN